MSNLHNLKDYKKSKIIIEDLEGILKIIKLTIKGLKLFKYYNSAQKLIIDLENEQLIIEGQLKKVKEVRDSKGKL